MCIAALADYDAETARQMCELEAMLIASEVRRAARAEHAGIRINNFMPAAAVDSYTPPCDEPAVAGAYQEKAA